MEHLTAQKISPIRKSGASRRDKFVELAQRRTKNAIKAETALAV